MIYWLTGQPGAGKTTLAKRLIEHISKKTTLNPVHIDGDDLRDIFENKNYSEEGRRQNINRAQEIAKFMSYKGHDVVVSLVSPYRDQREDFKKENPVAEIYVSTSEERGRESYHVKEYQPPTYDFIQIDTTHESEDSSVSELLFKLGL